MPGALELAAEDAPPEDDAAPEDAADEAAADEDAAPDEDAGEAAPDDDAAPEDAADEAAPEDDAACEDAGDDAADDTAETLLLVAAPPEVLPQAASAIAVSTAIAATAAVRALLVRVMVVPFSRWGWAGVRVRRDRRGAWSNRGDV